MKARLLSAIAVCLLLFVWQVAVLAQSPGNIRVIMDGNGQLLLAPVEFARNARPAQGDRASDMLPAFVERAVAHLSTSLGLEPEGISLWSLERTTFRDGSLGKPEPGRMYTQALVQGYVIILRAGDRFYRYHSDGTRVVYLGEYQKLQGRNLPTASN